MVMTKAQFVVKMAETASITKKAEDEISGKRRPVHEKGAWNHHVPSDGMSQLSCGLRDIFHILSNLYFSYICIVRFLSMMHNNLCDFLFIMALHHKATFRSFNFS